MGQNLLFPKLISDVFKVYLLRGYSVLKLFYKSGFLKINTALSVWLLIYREVRAADGFSLVIRSTEIESLNARWPKVTPTHTHPTLAHFHLPQKHRVILDSVARCVKSHDRGTSVP